MFFRSEFISVFHLVCLSFFTLIQNGQVLDSCISLGAHSSYSVSSEEGVELEVYHKAPQQDSERKEDLASQSPSITTEKPMEMTIEFQVFLAAIFLLYMAMISQESSILMYEVRFCCCRLSAQNLLSTTHQKT